MHSKLCWRAVKTTAQTIGYAAIVHTVKGLNTTFKYFEWKMKIIEWRWLLIRIWVQKYDLVCFPRKMSLINETLRLETETRSRHLTFSSRRDRDRDVPTFHRDRDETETLGKCVWRPSRDRDVETETTSVILIALKLKPAEWRQRTYIQTTLATF